MIILTELTKWLIVVLLLPTLAWAECAAWKLCPYDVDPNDACSRWLSIARAPMPAWEEIEVDGPGRGAGHALVCFKEVDPGNLAASYGCENVGRGRLESLIQKPAVPFCEYEADGRPKGINFYDGKGGRPEQRFPYNSREVRKRIPDSALDTGVLNK